MNVLHPNVYAVKEEKVTERKCLIRTIIVNLKTDEHILILKK